MDKIPKGPTQLCAEIVHCIAINGRLVGKDVVELVNAPESTIRWHLRAMVKDGRLDCTDDGYRKYYTVPKKIENLPDTRTEKVPRMVSRGPRAFRKA